MKRYFLAFMIIGVLAAAGCQRGAGPKGLLQKYFSTAMKKDFAATYTCYYAPYRAKISEAEYVKHRLEDPATLLGYKILSLKQQGDAASAVVVLTFIKKGDPKQPKPFPVTVSENMIKEHGDWRIKVW